MGTFTAGPLEASLTQYALISAVNDVRFNPISLEEIPDLQVGVSLLINFETVKHPLDWEIGKHGIEIEFMYSGKIII